MSGCVLVWQLYGDFAEPYQLSKCKLAIIHCAGHCDPTLVEALWTEIIDKGEQEMASGNTVHIYPLPPSPLSPLIELVSTQRHPRETRIQNMRAKLVRLGQLYCHSERYYPLIEFTTRCKERLGAATWVVD